jgi:divalent metal cation (Fe/Co/Zn/Cd) transporter
MDASARALLRRRGLLLNYAALGYNCIEGLVALIAGAMAGSVALLTFGIDSMIEVTASGAAQWRLRADLDHARRERVERITVRLIGWTFLALAAYIVIDSGKSLWSHERPEGSVIGIALLSLSVVIMPLLARAKRNVAREMNSAALTADAKQTSLCGYLSAIALAGVALNALLGWWWADPVAALIMVPIIVMEGLEGVRGDTCDDR